MVPSRPTLTDEICESRAGNTYVRIRPRLSPSRILPCSSPASKAPPWPSASAPTGLNARSGGGDDSCFVARRNGDDRVCVLFGDPHAAVCHHRDAERHAIGFSQRMDLVQRTVVAAETCVSGAAPRTKRGARHRHPHASIGIDAEIADSLTVGDAGTGPIMRDRKTDPAVTSETDGGDWGGRRESQSVDGRRHAFSRATAEQQTEADDDRCVRLTTTGARHRVAVPTQNEEPL